MNQPTKDDYVVLNFALILYIIGVFVLIVIGISNTKLPEIPWDAGYKVAAKASLVMDSIQHKIETEKYKLKENEQ